MHQNIKNNNVKSLDAKLYNAKYYDFMLYKGEAAYQDKNDLDNMSIADFSSLNIISGILYSTVLLLIIFFNKINIFLMISSKNVLSCLFV